MQKIKYYTFFVTQSYFSVPKGVRLNSKHYLILKINNRKELQNIAINYSVDIDYNDFARIYRKCTRMTVTDQLKIIDNKNKANQVQYDLDRLAAKISVYSSDDLRKYEYLTGEDLEYKPSVFEEVKFDYSLLGNIFTKGLDKDDQKEGFVKRLENIKDKNEELLNALSAANNVSKSSENESDFNYDSNYAFYKFYADFKKFKRMSLGS